MVCEMDRDKNVQIRIYEDLRNYIGGNFLFYRNGEEMDRDYRSKCVWGGGLGRRGGLFTWNSV
jgi:hypothetical protein